MTESEGVNPKDLIGTKKAPLHLVPPALAIRVAPVLALGAAKYGPFNWRQYPVKLSVYLEAAQRHLLAFADGQDLDPESGEWHVAHAAACLAIVLDAEGIGHLVDDRPSPGPAADLLAAQDHSKPPEPSVAQRTCEGMLGGEERLVYAHGVPAPEGRLPLIVEGDLP